MRLGRWGDRLALAWLATWAGLAITGWGAAPGLWRTIGRGAQHAFLVGVGAATLALAVGVTVGGLAALGPRWADGLLARGVELGGALPSVVLVAVVQVSWPGSAYVVLTLGMLRALEMARLFRTISLRLSHEDFVLAARALGDSPRRVFYRHIVPHLAGPMSVSWGFTAAWAIGIEAALTYLGFEQHSSHSWGATIGSWSRGSAPLAAIFALVCLGLTTLALHRLGALLARRWANDQPDLVTRAARY